MKTSDFYFDEIFEFCGLWGLPSKCGLRHFEQNGKTVVIVTELYQDNPGSSITSVAASLAKQVAEKFHYDPAQMVYIECNPDMESKLSFYDEEYFRVVFELQNGEYQNPQWQKLTRDEFDSILTT